MNSASLASSPTASEQPPASPAELRARLSGRIGVPGPYLITVRAPNVDANAVASLFPSPVGLLWAPPSGRAFAALGAAEFLTGTGSDRVEQVRERARSLFSRLVVDDHAGGLASRPRLFGGFAFQAGRAESSPWEDFGDARFFLPEYSYVASREAASFGVAVGTGSKLGREEIERAVSVYASLVELGDRIPLSQSRASATALEQMSLESWTSLVEAIRALIAPGGFEKIVLARRAYFRFDRDIDPSRVLAELEHSATNCTRFAFRFGQSTFLGATPERLIRKRGLAIETDALAGSSQIGNEEQQQALAKSPKELQEHQFTLNEIVRCLQPICSEVRHSTVPEIRRLRHILHLHTPIRATLAHPLHVLHLVERLHPTPAVGGLPTRAALQWIASNEPVERGWYAAPVGWFDDAGDGEFNVALRSGIVRGSDAFLFAGSGIVRDSDPKSEYAETELKLASLASALRLS